MSSKLNARKGPGLQKCERKFRTHKLEKKPLHHKLWWDAQFKELEAELTIPEYKKQNCLRNIFTEKEFDDIVNCGAEVIRERSLYDNLKYSTVFIQPNRNKTNIPRRSTGARLNVKKSTNPYMEFMNKPKKEACTWYPKPERDLADIHIIERAEKLKTDIAKKFLEKFESIFISEGINEYTLISILELICPFPISEALNTTNMVYGSMPETTTKHLGCHNLSDRSKLLNEILKDIQACEMPPAKTAFGLNLPIEMRRMPFKEHPGAKWASLGSGHESIESFAAVWKDITELESTRRFCLYLLDHPEVDPPPYLLEQGMLIKKILRSPVYLGDLEKQFETDTTSHLVEFCDLLNSKRKSRGRYSNKSLSEPAATSSRSLSIEVSDVNIMV